MPMCAKVTSNCDVVKALHDACERCSACPRERLWQRSTLEHLASMSTPEHPDSPRARGARPPAPVRRRRRPDRRGRDHACGRIGVEGLPHPRRRRDRLGAARRGCRSACCRRARRARPPQRAAQLAIRIVVQGVAEQARGLRADPARQPSLDDDGGRLHGRRPARPAGAGARRARRRRRRTRRRRCAARCTGSATAAAAAARCASSIELVLRAQERWDDVRAPASSRRRDETLTFTLYVLLALLAGLAIGKAWERYKLQDGRWIDRRRARESPHYMLGLNFLVAEPDRSGDRGADTGRRRRPATRSRST